MNRYWIGIAFIVLGCLILLRSFERIYVEELFRTYWPVAVILIGVVIVVKELRKNS